MNLRISFFRLVEFIASGFYRDHVSARLANTFEDPNRHAIGFDESVIVDSFNAKAEVISEYGVTL